MRVYWKVKNDPRVDKNFVLLVVQHLHMLWSLSLRRSAGDAEIVVGR